MKRKSVRAFTAVVAAAMLVCACGNEDAAEESVQTEDISGEAVSTDKEDADSDSVSEQKDITISIDRADDKLFTILVSFYDESGGAHPNHGTTSVNVDPLTGAELSLSQVLDNDENIATIIRDELTKDYPEQVEEFDSYYYQGEGEDSDVFKQKYIDGTYNFSVNGDGLYIFFSPYDIASYAAGYMEITISPDKYPDLIKKEYILSQSQDMEKIVETKDGESFEVEALDMEGAFYNEETGI